MSLSPHEQFLQAVERSERPVIVLPELAHVDDIASAFGLTQVFKALGKNVELVCAGGRAPENLSFLEQPVAIKGDFSNLKSLTLHVDLRQAKVDQLSYKVEGDELLIHLVPKLGAWNQSDVRIASTSYRYDLVIALGAQDLKALGALFTIYPDFFFQTPSISLGHEGSQEPFGNINLIDLTATSVGEVCHDLVMSIDAKLLTPAVATAFLTGMVAKTKSFKTPNVTPKTLSVASSLIEHGAKREEVVEKLFRTRSVETLRLWGRALARLKSDSAHGLVWTTLTKQDFVLAGASADVLPDIVSEVLTTAPDAKVVAILFETNDAQHAAHLFAERPHDALHLAAAYKASGTRERAKLLLPEETLVEAERNLISHLKRRLA